VSAFRKFKGGEETDYMLMSEETPTNIFCASYLNTFGRVKHYVSSVSLHVTLAISDATYIYI
jgi:hypothetical protein